MCRAIDYPGGRGGARIQNAINDGSCRIIQIDSSGPDDGQWLLDVPIFARSGVTLEGSSGARPTLLPSGGDVPAIIILDGVNGVTVRSVSFQGAKRSNIGVFVRASREVTIADSSIARFIYFGVHIAGQPSNGVTISRTTFEDNGLIDVRTDTSSASVFHSRVRVENSTMRGTKYGIAFANCGGSADTACEANENVIRSARVLDGSGLDLNRSHHARLARNRVEDCGHGITIDDTRDALITGNEIRGCLGDGIQVANGAVPENRPWILTGNRIQGNAALNNGGWGIATYRSGGSDQNRANVFSNNRVEGNRSGGCINTAPENTFTSNGPQRCPQ